MCHVTLIATLAMSRHGKGVCGILYFAPVQYTGVPGPHSVPRRGHGDKLPACVGKAIAGLMILHFENIVWGLVDKAERLTALLIVRVRAEEQDAAEPDEELDRPTPRCEKLLGCLYKYRTTAAQLCREPKYC